MYAEIFIIYAAAAGALLVEAAGIAAKVYAVTPGGLCFDVSYILADQGDISLAAGRGLDPVGSDHTDLNVTAAGGRCGEGFARHISV